MRHTALSCPCPRNKSLVQIKLTVFGEVFFITISICYLITWTESSNPILLHTCATWIELPSYVCTMIITLAK